MIVFSPHLLIYKLTSFLNATYRILIEKERDDLLGRIRHHFYSLHSHSLTEGLSSGESILTELSFIVHLSKEEKQALLAAAEKRLLSRGHYLYRHGERSCGIYVIARGLVHVLVDNKVVETIGVGSVIGSWSLLSNENFFADAQAHSLVEAFFLDRDLVLNTLIKDKKVHDTLWKMAAATLIKAYFRDAFPRSSPVAMTKMCSEAALTKPTPMSNYSVTHLSLVVNGRVMFDEENNRGKVLRRSELAPVLLVPSKEPIKFADGSLLLTFGADVEGTDTTTLTDRHILPRKKVDLVLQHFHAPKLELLRYVFEFVCVCVCV